MTTTSYKYDVMTANGFRRYERGVEAYKDVQVIQGPVCCEDGIRSYGTTTSGIMFIGISPARDETTRTMRPLTGPSGQLLNACLEALELDRKDMYCTNLVCTWMDNPSVEDITRCMPRLEYEIAILKPKLIVTLGTLVTEILLERKFGKVRGAVQWSDHYNAYMMGTYHPEAIIHSMDDRGSSKDDKSSKMIADFIRDIKKLHTVPSWLPGAPEAKVRYRVVTSSEQAQNVLDNLPRSSEFPISLDVETTYSKNDEEVEVFKDDVLCVGVGSENYAWVFTPDALYNDDGTPALNWPNNIHWTMHNSTFDAQVMRRKLGQWITIHEDTMLESYSLDERSGIHRLKTLAREYLAVGFYEDDRFYGKMTLDKILPEMLYEYNAKDVVYTTRLHLKQKPLQIQDGVRDFYERILIPAVNMFKEVQYHGVGIDMNLHAKLTAEWCVKWLIEEQELQEIAKEEGWEGEINLNSGAQLGTFLFNVLSLPIVKRTPKGEPSVDKEVLEKLEPLHPFIAKLKAYRTRTKMIGTYIQELPQKLKVDGRAHPIVKLHGTVTGRPAYTDLAVQTFVRPDTKTEYNQMRKLIIPPPYEIYEGTDDYVPPEDDDYIIVEVDYGKQELWVAYSYSHDPQMLDDLLSGDYHTVVAADVFQKIQDEITGDDRNTGKRVTFGILYDIEAAGLATQTKSELVVAQQRIDRWNNRNKVHHEWALETQAQIRETGEIITKIGRKRRIVILGSTVRAEKQAVNFPVQSTGSDIVLDAAIEMHPKLKAIGSHILFTVHDSIVTKCLRSRLNEHCKIMHDIMTAKRFPGVVPIPIEIKLGSSWGDVKGVHECDNRKPNKLEIPCDWKERIALERNT